MCSKGFNVAGGIMAFITAGQAYDKQFAIMTLSGDGQDIMRTADVPTTREDIESIIGTITTVTMLLAG
jgi:hypothetical protein